MHTLINIVTFMVAFTLTVYAGLAHAHAGHKDVSFMFNHGTSTLLIIAKPGQSIADACADGKRVGYTAQVTKVQTVGNNKFVYTICK